MKFLRTLAAAALIGTTSLAAAGLSPAQAGGTVYAAGDTTSGTYMDYMKTVYARAGNPEITQIPLTSFDKDFQLKRWRPKAGRNRKTG